MKLVALLLLAGSAHADCDKALAPARGFLAVAEKAKQPSRKTEERAREAWAAVEPECRGGRWYAFAAALLRHPGHAKAPLVAGDAQFASAREALDAGLKAAPGDAELMAYVAYVARVAPASGPALPEGACAAATGWSAPYVCAEGALAGGRTADAAKALTGFADARVPDLTEIKRLAGVGGKTPAPRLTCAPFCPADGWRVPSRK